jgi:hypothetical protein
MSENVDRERAHLGACACGPVSALSRPPFGLLFPSLQTSMSELRLCPCYLFRYSFISVTLFWATDALLRYSCCGMKY